MSRRDLSKDYFEPGDRINAAIQAASAVKSSFVGDTIEARSLILALCDQAGLSIEAQRAVAALLYLPEAALPSALQRPKTDRLHTKES